MLSALEVLRHALATNADSTLLLRLQVDFNCAIGAYGSAIDACRRLLGISANEDLAAFSNLLWMLNFVPGISCAEVLDEHKRFDGVVSSRVRRVEARPLSKSARRARIGYLSRDFRRHAVASFIRPLLQNHDRSAFEVHCFYDFPSSDEQTLGIMKSTECWHDISGIPDDELAQIVMRQGIDILVDLAGHTGHNRMRLFAMKPAPVQVTWLGYLCTTGLAAMDFRLCDSHTDPSGVAEHWQVERPARLPDSQWCYQPQIEIPPPTALPRLRNGFWTFGSFNQESKLNSNVIDSWGRVLAKIPDSRLCVVGVSYDAVEERIRHTLARHGIGAGGNESANCSGATRFKNDFSSALAIVDIAFDSFPYNGATTTCDSLIMGVPGCDRRGTSVDSTGRNQFADDRRVRGLGGSVIGRLGRPYPGADCGSAAPCRFARFSARPHARIAPDGRREICEERRSALLSNART